MLLDAHQHYWRPARGDYGWMEAPGLEALRRDFLPAHLEPDLARHGIEGTIVVQAAPSVAETDFLLGLAAEHASVLGVVGFLDLESADFGAELARLLCHPKFVGLRPMLQDLPDDAYVVRPRVLDNLSRLADAGRALDLLVFPRHLPFVRRALAALPGLRAVVDHCAKPDLRSGELWAWRRELGELGALPGLHCKLSGLVTEARPDCEPSDLLPAVDFVYEVFGPDRLLFGSDWPVCTLRADYARVLELSRQALGTRLTADVERAIFGDNARRFYGV